MGEPSLADVLRAAADLQRIVPDAVLVGGSAAALWADHRDSFVHDHVLTDLSDRYLEVLEAVEATDGWVISVRASAPPLTIMGSLGGIEAGLRQLRRSRPLEVERIRLDDEHVVVVPTLPETLRVKAYLVVQRNQVRDYLDVVALAERYGHAPTLATLVGIDDYYTDRSGQDDSVLTALVQRLSEPNPRDRTVTEQLSSYRRLEPRWHQWSDVVRACEALADGLLRMVEET